MTNDPAALALHWAQTGRKVALATVVATWGSAPRGVGSQLVIDADGAMEGSVSGGCVEGAVVLAAMDAIMAGQHAILEFGVSDDAAFAVGLACGGQFKVLVQPVGDGLSITTLQALAEARAAIFFRDSGAKQSSLAHQREQFRRVAFGPVSIDHARLQLALRKGAGGVADHAFVFGQLVVKTERVGPIECCQFGHFYLHWEGQLNSRLRYFCLYKRADKTATLANNLRPCHAQREYRAKTGDSGGFSTKYRSSSRKAGLLHWNGRPSSAQPD